MADAQRDTRPESGEPVGLGGWLIVPIVGFAGAILLNGWSLVQTLAAGEGLKLIFDRDDEVFAPLRLSLGLSLVGEAALVVSAALCLHLIFAKRRAAVPFAIAHYVILAAVGLVNVWSESRAAETMIGMARSHATTRAALLGTAALIIWGPYFAVSKRVRNTFVEPRTLSPTLQRNASADSSS